ncbi:MAG: hypothetical protein AAFR49_17720, partial [Pseudomonadota bacterium]
MGKLADHRTVANFDKDGFEILEMPGLPGEQVWWKNVSFEEATGQGSYLLIMAPGTRCNPHRHNGPEEFYIIEGDLEKCSDPPESETNSPARYMCPSQSS